MKKSLIALAAAGVLASGAAVADGFAIRVHDGNLRGNVRVFAVQDYRYDRWSDGQQWDDGRRFGIDDRQARIRGRIYRGEQIGALTPREARRLYRELGNIEAKERALESDGRLGRRERDNLHQDLDRLAANVRYEQRDDQRRY